MLKWRRTRNVSKYYKSNIINKLFIGGSGNGTSRRSSTSNTIPVSAILARTESRDSNDSSGSGNGNRLASALSNLAIKDNPVQTTTSRRKSPPPVPSNTTPTTLLSFNVTPPKSVGPSEAERKIEALTKQIEEQMEREEQLEYFGKSTKICIFSRI